MFYSFVAPWLIPVATPLNGFSTIAGEGVDGRQCEVCFSANSAT